MAVSLTKQEFFERLVEMNAILRLAIVEDLKSPTSPLIGFEHKANADISVEMAEILAPVVKRVLFQAVGRVYGDRID